ncbi:hypothetical protein F5876DRAFT_70904 [Lentinula aff. lateritia]|uniref:Uncharacterized protein n=1 Tax=Lentinula aff. lateritia TaxID=2804960 RepID=A0ACC1THE9_9AGAR|nr:hypothetical protein F5876DRAFT_70904 [Lentinula aff. lateritia]
MVSRYKGTGTGPMQKGVCSKYTKLGLGNVTELLNSVKKTCSLGKILQYWYFARRCSQDIAYSRRFLELQGTPAHQSTWGIPLSTWRHYDAALHARTSSTSTLLELNMLDDQDTADADQQELRNFLSLQQGEAAVAAKRKCERSPLPVAGPSSRKVPSDGSKKCFRRRTPVEEAAPESPRRVRLVVPPVRLMAASTSTPVPPSRDLPMQGPSDLVQLATVAEAHSGLVQRVVSPPSARTPIKGAGQDLLSSKMPPTPHSTLVPHTLASHPYRAENQCLAARVCLLESQLADLQRENSSLTSGLRDTCFLRRGLDSDDLNVVVHNFRLALDYMQAARGVHGDLYMWSMSSIQWFFNNAVDEDEGLYRMVLDHSRFDNDGPFLTAAQHAGFAPPPDNSLEPPLHRRMLALSTALPHSTGVGMWDDIVPLFLPEQESPTSPSPPPPSPTLPPLFGSVANLAIDLTGDDDKLYEAEESRVERVSVMREVVDLPAGQGTVKEELL